jgi:hypothetical protein
MKLRILIDTGHSANRNAAKSLFLNMYRLHLLYVFCVLLARWFLAELISSTLNIEAIVPPKRRLTRRYIPEDGTLQIIFRFVFMSVLIYMKTKPSKEV